MYNNDKEEQIITNVIYIFKQNAKQIKTLLEENHVLDKRFRLTKVDPTYFSSCTKYCKDDINNNDNNKNDDNENGFCLEKDTDKDKDNIMNKCIAIPIVKSYPQIVLDENHHLQENSSTSWIDILSQNVIRYGKQSCLFSSSTLGNINAIKSTRLHHGTDENAKLNEKNILQQILFNTIVSFITSSTSPASLMNYVDKLSTIACPTKLEIMGDDRTIVLPFKAFNYNVDVINSSSDATRETTTQSSSSSGSYYSYNRLLDEFVYNNATHDYQMQSESRHNHDYDKFHVKLWYNIAKLYNSSRIVRRGEIDPNSKIRHSGHVILWIMKDDSNHDHDDKNKNKDNGNDYDKNSNNSNGPKSKGWITITEQKIKQSFDLTKVMFSRGNVSEKIRFGKLVQENDIVVDMYAGIGYYTLPALIYGKAKYVYACEWNVDAIFALKYNLIQNGVDDRVTVVEGDSRIRLKEKEFLNIQADRISLGLLPSSEGGWKTAVRLLRNDEKGGWLHVHGNVPTAERENWCLWVCQQISKIYLDVKHCDEEDLPFVICSHLERVKSFAPKVDHLVADIFVGKKLPCELKSSLSELIKLDEQKVGMICSSGNFHHCPQRIQIPSCAFAAGILNQQWMMDEYE